MPRTLALLALLVPLTAVGTSCNEGPEAPRPELAMSLRVVEVPSLAPNLLVRAHIRNTGNVATVSRGGCWLVDFSMIDPGGNPLNVIDPCLLSVIRCAESVVELSPDQLYEEDLFVGGVTYVTSSSQFRCEQIPMAPGLYTVSASFAYRTEFTEPGAPDLMATASTTLFWSPGS